MRQLKTFPMAALLLATLTGCAAMQQPSSPTAVTAAQAQQAGATSLEEGQSLGALPQAAIPAEACGMILWTVSSQRPVPVFRFISGEKGEIQLGGRLVELTLTNVSGDSGFGVFENLVFQNPDGLIVEVSADFGVGFSGGSYLENGVIRMQDAAGWSAVTPAAGVAGCR